MIGAENDYIVDREGVLETGRFFGVEPIFVPDLYHDVMLGPKWRATADILLSWLKSIRKSC